MSLELTRGVRPYMNILINKTIIILISKMGSPKWTWDNHGTWSSNKNSDKKKKNNLKKFFGFELLNLTKNFETHRDGSSDCPFFIFSRFNSGYSRYFVKSKGIVESQGFELGRYFGSMPGLPTVSKNCSGTDLFFFLGINLHFFSAPQWF